MDPLRYEQHRNALAVLLNDAAAIGELDAGTREAISQTSRRIQENQFEIVLAADYQCGKSTTFNALCDGHVCSPMGVGLKTSAALISVQHLSDSAEAYAEIAFRSDPELLLSFIDILIRPLSRLAADRFKEGLSAEEAVQLLDMRRDAGLINQAIDTEWQRYAQNRALYDSEDGVGRLSQLRVGSLVMAHAGSTKLDALRVRHRFDIAELSRLIRFPEDWEQRWEAGRDAARTRFATDDCVYVFIKDVRIRRPLPGLGRLGCVVTDAPGLLASPWDTAVATAAMQRADAIWFLIPVGKDLAGSLLDQLRMIKTLQLDHKLFITCNERDNTRRNIRSLTIPSTEAKLRQASFLGTGVKTLPFSAVLALRASQGRLILDGGLTDYDRSELIKEANDKFGDDADPQPCGDERTAWVRLTRYYIRVLLPGDLDKEPLSQLDAAAVERTERISGLRELRAAVEKLTVERKAWSILIDNGARRVADALQTHEGQLQLLERAAHTELEKWEAEKRTAEEKLSEFRTFVEQELDPLREDAIDRALFDDLWSSSLEPALRESIPRMADRINDAHGKMMLNTHALDEEVRDIVRNEIGGAVRLGAAGWQSGIEQGKSRIYETKIRERADRIYAKVKRRWGQIAEDDSLLRSTGAMPPLDHLMPELLVSEAVADADDINQEFYSLYDGIVSYVLQQLWGWLSDWGSQVVNTVAGWFGIETAQPPTGNAIRSHLEGKLLPLLRVQQDEMRGNHNLMENLASYRTAAMAAISHKTDAIAATLRSHCERCDRSFKQTQVERDRIATEAERVRTGIIAPLRARVEAFQANVLPDLNKDPAHG